MSRREFAQVATSAALAGGARPVLADEPVRDVGSRLELFVDGRRTGEERHRLSHTGEFEPMGEAQLARGTHEVTMRYGKADDER